ncbi:putative methyltransferase PMT25 [Hibiscus syriacus]|uniref:Methyltransferase n=1 Tax=Hibiscus syriacus TaxID=106335 RepID=A0A6A2YVX0_HIBSY|nr:putative methyltransferase PMT25 [Hibiscus syriacus]
MLGVGWLAFEAIPSKEMFLPCHLLLRMSMKPKCSLLSNGGFLHYQICWAPKGFLILVSSSILCTVHVAGSPSTVEGGKLLLELSRVLRPGGYFVWSATPVYQKLPEDVGIWEEMSQLTKSMCWDLVTVKKDRLNAVGAAIYRKPTTNDCAVAGKSYLNGMGIDWSSVRNVMDMKAVYGGFAAALKDLKVWVMNVVPVDSPDTLPVIYERHLFASILKRCKLVTVIAEVDRILRPEGKLIVRDTAETISELESMAKSLQWEIRMIYLKDGEGFLC